MDILHIFAINLKKSRKEAGISQEKLAELSMLHRTYICAVENEKRNISLQNLQRIADALGTTPYKLLIPSEEQENEDSST